MIKILEIAESKLTSEKAEKIRDLKEHWKSSVLLLEEISYDNETTPEIQYQIITKIPDYN